MKYSEFKEYLIQHIPAALPAKYEDAEVILEKRYKVNQELESFTIVSKDGNKKISVAPTFYFKELYGMYKEGAELSDILNYIVMEQEAEIPYEIESRDILDFDKMIRKITLQLINHGRNEELLKNVVHQDFLDLAVVYRVEFKRNEDAIASTLVNQEILESWGISKEMLHEVAVKNTRRELPTVFINPNALGDMENDEEGIYVLTNRSLQHGASELVFDDVLRRASEVIGGNFYILPSSIHELFVCRADDTDESHLKWVILYANKSIVEPDEFLSDSLYFYDTKEKMVKIA